MFNFLKNQNNAFGLDLTGSSFKLIQFGRMGQDITVQGYSDVALPKGLVLNDAIVDVKTFTYLLKQSLLKAQFGHFSGNFVVASLPESKSFVRVIQLPLMSESEISTAVPVEAESFIPLPIDQVYLDWQILGRKEDKQEILIIASPKEFVDKYVGVLESAGLTVNALEVESQSCQRALIDPKTKPTCLIVDLDAFRTSLIMVEEGNLQFTSSIPIAGNTFTESIARLLGVSSQKAEIIKRKVGVANTAEYPNIRTGLLPVLNNLSAEIKNIIKFHSEHSASKVSKIFLAGGSARLKNLAQSLQPEFDPEGITVEIGNPWVNLPELKQLPWEGEDSLSFTTAIGLAMRGLKE